MLCVCLLIGLKVCALSYSAYHKFGFKSGHLLYSNQHSYVLTISECWLFLPAFLSNADIYKTAYQSVQIFGSRFGPNCLQKIAPDDASIQRFNSASFCHNKYIGCFRSLELLQCTNLVT